MISKILNQNKLTRSEIIELLNIDTQNELEMLFTKAEEIKEKFCGKKIDLRASIEFFLASKNIPLPKDGTQNKDYLQYENIIKTVKDISAKGISSIILEANGSFHFDTDMVSFLIYSIKNYSDIDVTLSFGERLFEEYSAWKIAGADRYLMKYDNCNLQDFSNEKKQEIISRRFDHIKYLKEIGFNVGIKNMIAYSAQNIKEIADDILLCKKLDVDLAIFSYLQKNRKESFNLKALFKITAILRLVLPKADIPLLILTENRFPKELRIGNNIVITNYPFPLSLNN